MAMADGFLMFQLRIVEVFAAQPVPQFFPANAAPGVVHLLARKRQQLRHSADAGVVQTPLHARANAGQVAQHQAAERGFQNVRSQRHQAVGLLHVGGDLGQVAVRRKTHRAAQRRPHMLADRCFDAAGQIESRHQRLLPPDQACTPFRR